MCFLHVVISGYLGCLCDVGVNEKKISFPGLGADLRKSFLVGFLWLDSGE